MIKKLVCVSLVLLAGCSSNSLSSVNTTDNSDKLNVSQLKQSGVIAKDAKEVFIADVGHKNGASFSMNIDLSKAKFTTKDSTNGSTAKTSDDIQSLRVYLIQNSNTNYPLDGDPMNEVVAGPFDLNRTGPGPYTVTFTNVGESASGTKYFAAVRAFDGYDVANSTATGNELIKANNGRTGPNEAWTGQTESTTANPSASQISVSTGTGVGVDANLAVDTTDPLQVTINLIDAVGATIDALVTPNSGSNTLPAVSAN